VTQTALVAVNSAVTNGAWPGSARDTGSIIKTVPMAIAPRNANGTIRAGYCHDERPRTTKVIPLPVDVHLLVVSCPSFRSMIAVH